MRLLSILSALLLLAGSTLHNLTFRKNGPDSGSGAFLGYEIRCIHSLGYLQYARQAMGDANQDIHWQEYEKMAGAFYPYI